MSWPASSFVFPGKPDSFSKPTDNKMKDMLLEPRPSHYDAAYFARQRRAGEFRASFNLKWFQAFVRRTDQVIDFGCGGGYLLNALEHVFSPYDMLVTLKPKVKPGGLLVFVVPHQGPREQYRQNDPNQHLYT